MYHHIHKELQWVGKGWDYMYIYEHETWDNLCIPGVHMLLEVVTKREHACYHGTDHSCMLALVPPSCRVMWFQAEHIILPHLKTDYGNTKGNELLTRILLALANMPVKNALSVFMCFNIAK